MRRLCYALFVVILLASCRDKVICPTFQSTYILDDSVRSTYFSYLWYLDEDERKNYLASKSKIPPQDSLGVTLASADVSGGADYWEYTAQYKVLPGESKRTKYGIAKRTPIIPNLVRNMHLKTSPMENVLTPPEVKADDPVAPAASPSDSSAIAPLDSTAAVTQTDSLGTSQPVAESKEEKAKKEWERFKYGFNPLDSMQPDQEYYFRKYGWLLQNAPPPEEKVDSTALDSSVPDSLRSDSTSGKGLKGLLGKLRGNKDKPKKEKKKKKKEEEPEGPGANDEAAIPEEEEEGGSDPNDGR